MYKKGRAKQNCGSGYTVERNKCVKWGTAYKSKKRRGICAYPWRRIKGNKRKCQKPIQKHVYKRKKIKLKGVPIRKKCHPGKVEKWKLCYPKCSSGWERRSSKREYCTKTCPLGWKMNNLRTACIRPKYSSSIHTLSDVGICDPDLPVRIGDECYAK